MSSQNGFNTSLPIRTSRSMDEFSQYTAGIAESLRSTLSLPLSLGRSTKIAVSWKMFFFFFSGDLWDDIADSSWPLLGILCFFELGLLLAKISHTKPQKLRDHAQVPNGMWHIRCLCWNTNSLNCGPPLVPRLEDCGVGLWGLVLKKIQII